MYVQKKKQGRRVVAGEEVEVTPEASEILFQADDVADVLAEVTDQNVSADVVDDETGAVEFTIGEDEDAESYVVEPEGDEEIVESASRIKPRKRVVKASTRSTRRGGSKRVVRRGRR